MNNSDVIFEWSVHPIADFPKRRTVFLVAVGITLLAIWTSFNDPYWVFFSLVFLLAALNSFVLPTRYRLSETELEIHRLVQVKLRKLDTVRRLDVHPGGFFLSPLRIPSRLENYRGVFLPCTRDRQPEIETFLRKHIRQLEHLTDTEQAS
jgi:hypothetical protein